MSPQSRGFTLVEILVVLAIVAVLAAILLTVFSRMRENGRKATCQSNLHQIYAALSQYVADSDSHLPISTNAKAVTDIRVVLRPYIKSKRVFLCPSVNRPLPKDEVDDGIDYGYAGAWLLTFNLTPSNGGLPTLHPVGINEALFVDAAKIHVAGDVAYSDSSQETPLPRGAACGITNPFGTPVTSSEMSTRHGGGANDLFYDGHVKWMTPEQAAAEMCDEGQYVQPPFRAGGPHLTRDFH